MPIYDVTYYFAHQFLERDFLEGGGIREEMTRARLAYRRRQELNGANGTEGTDWANE